MAARTAANALRMLRLGGGGTGARTHAAPRLASSQLQQQQHASSPWHRTFTASALTVHDQHRPQPASPRGQSSEALNRTRSKIPTAKAKAAQASRAQLRPPSSSVAPAAGVSAGAGVASSSSSAAAAAAGPSASSAQTQQQSQQHAPQAPQQAAQHQLQAARQRSASPLNADDEHDLAALPEVIAYSTAQAYDFAVLARSNRLPPGWSFLEEGDVIHIPIWPPAHAEHASSASAAAAAAAAAPTTSYNSAPLPGETFIFRSGAYVTWGLTEDQARRFHRAVIRGRPGDATAPRSKIGSKAATNGGGANHTGTVELGAYDQIGDEAMEYLIRDDQPTRVVGDLIVLGHKPRLLSTDGAGEAETSNNSSIASNGQSSNTSATSNDSTTYAPWSPLLARLSFSLGLARSARLTTQESSLDMFMLNPSSAPSPSSSSAPPTASGSRSPYSHPGSARIPLSDIPRELERTGRVPLGRKEVIKRMGKLLRLRLEANLDVEESFLDDNAFWENERLQQHYDSICRALDIDRRFKAFNEKLDHVESLLSTIRALLTESSTHRMELIIIILIAIEVLNAFFGHQHQHQHHHHPSPALASAGAEGESEAQTQPAAVEPQSAGVSIPSVSGLFRWLRA
ncbi:hypothetical protein OC844_000436 [Tilletia horrida]|nr:hypothetical protein OC844_000436 [Tilletia horrida]